MARSTSSSQTVDQNSMPCKAISSVSLSIASIVICTQTNISKIKTIAQIIMHCPLQIPSHHPPNRPITLFCQEAHSQVQQTNGNQDAISAVQKSVLWADLLPVTLSKTKTKQKQWAWSKPDTQALKVVTCYRQRKIWNNVSSQLTAKSAGPM